MKTLSTLLLSLCLLGCGSLPEGIKPVTGFELERYTGTWYEIARLDHRFERGLDRVTATYSVNDDGTVRVENKGYSIEDGAWQDAVGKAKRDGEDSVGRFKVSFFGPFYAPYVIFDLDKDGYQHAFVTGSEDTLWLLARTPTVSDALKSAFLEKADGYGYNTEELIWVNHE